MEKKTFSTRTIILLLLVVFILVFPFVFNKPFIQHVMIMIFMYALLAEAWNIMGGYCALFSFGQCAFFGIGAYTSTFLYINYHLSPWLGMIIGGICGAAAGVVIGYPCSKLRGHYFAIATIAFAQTLNILFTNWNLVGGATGLSPSLTSGDSLVDFQFHSSKIPYYYIILGMLVISVYITQKVVSSKTGFYFRALRENPEVAESLGINTSLYRLVSIALSSFFTAIAGTFYAQYVLYIDPPSVMAHFLSCEIVLIATFGGSGTIYGPIMGAAVLVPISQYARAFLGGMGSGLDLMIYGIAITLICVFKPGGVIEFFKGIKFLNLERSESQ